MTENIQRYVSDSYRPGLQCRQGSTGSGQDRPREIDEVLFEHPKILEGLS